MESTSVSLLRRLRLPQQEEAWRRFVDLYAPLIFHWGRAQGLNVTDAADLVQEVMAILVVKLPDFEYDPRQRFRGWLRTVAVNKANDFHRRNALRPNSGEATLPHVSVSSEVDLFDEAQYRSFLANRALELMKTEFPENSWKACWRLVVDGHSGSAIAAELGISESAVYVAKCRIMKRLREELDVLLE